MNQPMQPWQGGGPPAGPPPGGWGQHAGAPPGPPPAPPTKKSNTWIFVVVGCGVLLVLSIPCAMVGLGMMAGGAAYSVARPVSAVPEPASSGAIVGSSPAGPVVAAAMGPSDPRDAAFAAYVLDATRAIESAARGMPHDARWDTPVGDADLRRAQPDNATVLAPLGAWTVAATSVEVEAIAPSPGGTGYVRSGVLVFPDGRVRWMAMSARVQQEVFVRPTVGLAQIAPVLSGEVDRMIEALRSPRCALPTASQFEMAAFPPALQRESTAATGLLGACRTVANLGATALWQPRFDDLTVLVSGNGQWATLRSGFEARTGRMTLGPVRARAVR